MRIRVSIVQGRIIGLAACSGALLAATALVAAEARLPGTPEEVRARLAELRRQFAPYLRSLPEARELRGRAPLGPEWRMKFEVAQASSGNRPEPPGWFREDFDDGAWETVTVPEWRFQAASYRRPISCILWYRTRFPAELPPPGRRTFLVFGGVDWEAEVWLDGKFLGRHRTYYQPFRFDVTSVLKAKNTLSVRVIDGPLFGEPRSFWSLFPMPHQGESRYVRDKSKSLVGHKNNCQCLGSGFGIHREVYLETTSEAVMTDVFVRANPQRQEATVTIEADTAAGGEINLDMEILPENFEGQAYRASMRWAMPQGKSRKSLAVAMPDAKSWTPSSPHLYRCRVTLRNGDRTIDGRDALFGCRSFGVVSKQNPRPGLPEGMFLLNDRPLFLRGTNVQGLNALWYWNEQERLIDVVLLLKAAHFNTIRACQHVCYPEVRELLDRLGMMSEQDQGSGTAPVSQEQLAQLPETGTALARACYNNPGVVLLSFGNETHFDPIRVIEAVLAVDPERILKPISGNGLPKMAVGYPITDALWANVVDDFHTYAGWYGGWAPPGAVWALSKAYPPGRLLTVGEYGAEALDGYQTMARNYPAHFLPVPPPEADTLWGHVQVEKADRRQIIGFRGRRPANLGQYIEASQTYQADLVAEVTKGLRLSPRRIGGYFQFHFIDVVPAHWPKSIVSHDLCPKKAYYEMARVNQPVVPLFQLVDQGEAMELWVANDLPEPIAGAKLRWKVAVGQKTLIEGEKPVDVRAVDAVQVVKVDLAPVPPQTDCVAISLVLLDPSGGTLARYEREVFLRAWREEDAIFKTKPSPEARGPQPARTDAPSGETRTAPALRLWKEIDIGEYVGSFVSPGDLDGDGRVDFLLSQMGPHTTPARLVAVDHEGKKLWEVGEAARREGTAGVGREPTCRAVASIYDVDGDGLAEVIAELWREGKPKFCLLDGATGRVRREVDSPLDMSVRQPKGYHSSRPVPMALVAHLHGRNAPPSLVLKYEASNRIPCHAFALDGQLKTFWHATTRPTGMGHIPTVADLDGDGRDEIVLGETILDGTGKALWQHEFGSHADATAVADVHPAPGDEVLVSICNHGPAYCLSGRNGTILWKKTREEIPHGQAIWAGDFLPDRPGAEVIVLRSGHVGDFVTLAGSDGAELARFRHRGTFDGYPDFPVAVRRKGTSGDSLWLPIDRRLVDGRGRTLADLGPAAHRVAERLGCGTTKDQLAAQAIAMDVCGDAREEILLYQPYNGRAIIIFTQPDSDGRGKPYLAQPATYNFRTYF